jgi:hypothetical protein
MYHLDKLMGPHNDEVQWLKTIAKRDASRDVGMLAKEGLFKAPPGKTYKADHEGQELQVYPSDVPAMVQHGFRDVGLAAKSLPSSDILRKRGAVAVLRHGIPGVGDPDRRVVFGTVEAKGGQVFVEHDQSADMIVIHGVGAKLADVAPSLRASFLYASAGFSQAENESEQVAARTLVGLVVNAIIDRHDFVGAKVRERLFSQRFD